MGEREFLVKEVRRLKVEVERWKARAAHAALHRDEVMRDHRALMRRMEGDLSAAVEARDALQRAQGALVERGVPEGSHLLKPPKGHCSQCGIKLEREDRAFGHPICGLCRRLLVQELQGMVEE